MESVALTLMVAIACFAFVIFMVKRWSINYVQRVMDERADAVNQIVHEGRVPETWIKRYAVKIQNLKQKPDSQKIIARYIVLAQKRCVANLDELIRFTEEAKHTDSDEAKRNLLASLREQRKRWNENVFWNKIFL